MLPVLIKIEPEGETPEEQKQAGSEKVIFVLSGRVDIIIKNELLSPNHLETYSLNKNNTLYFDASLKHSISNPGKLPAQILSVLTPVEL